MPSNQSIVTAGLRLLRQVLRAAAPPQSPSRQSPQRASPKPSFKPSPHGRPTSPPSSNGYPGDFTGTPRITYAPFDDDVADPGEVVWTWVPYEEDFSQGKDRPVLIIGRDGPWLLALQVTSQDHDVDAAQEARAGRYWEDIGTGAWDSQGRPSEARTNRIIRIDPDDVRRVGAMLGESTFNRVAKEVVKHH